MLRSSLSAALACCLLAGCVDGGTEDGAGDALTEGKADGTAYSPSEIAGALAFVNQASKATLVDEVGVSTRVATNITTHRAGADKELGTPDDDAFDTLRELDDIPYVGPRTFERLVDYARDHGFISGNAFCKSEHAGSAGGAPVAICDELYDSPPFVHLPADATSGTSVTVHGALMPGYGLRLFTADGRELALVSSAGERIYQSDTPGAFAMPDNLFTIYAVTGASMTFENEAAIEVKTVTPVARIPGSVQDALLLGTWEAKAATRVGERKFDEAQPVAFRFTLSSTTPTTIWSAYPGTDGLEVSGQVDNFTTRVKAADGTCLPSLSSLGTRSPFANATAPTIALWRHPNMHGINDQVIVMDYPTASLDLSQNGMSGMGPFSPIGLIQDGGPDYASVTIYPHATPTGHQVWDLHKVSSGGEACP